mgnify:CR=1 FL=1
MRIARIVIAVVLTLVASLATTRPALAAPPASGYVAQCAQSANTLSALFVLDRSGSLEGTDSQGIRYDALGIAVEQLSRMGRNAGRELAVEVAVSAFDHRYFSARDVVRWTRVDLDAFGGDAAQQQATVAQIVKVAAQESTPAGGTDFEAALNGAFKDMSDRGGPGDCRVVFWFTDGEFSVPGGEDAPRERMCRPGGILDQIRESGIVLIGIQLDADARDLLPMSEGEDQHGHTCGTVPIPSDWAPGLYLRADDTAGLKRVFRSLIDIVEGCTAADPATGLIDPGIRRFRMSIDTPRQLTAIRLDSPDGVTITPGLSGSSEERGYKVAVQTDDHYATVEVSLPQGQGAGNWAISTDPATTAADAALCVFHDLHLELADPQQQVPAGTTAEVLVRAVGPDGVPADLSAFASAAVGASAVGPDGTIRKTTASLKNGQIAVSLESLPTDARIELSLSMNPTTESGLALTPVTARIPLVLLLSREFPVVKPSDELDLGIARKLNPTSASLSLMGSPEGPTKVCFEPFVDVVVPDDAAGTTPLISDTCIELQTSQVYQVTVSVTPAAAAEGAGSASLPVVLHSAAVTPQSVRYEIPVVWRFENPLNVPVAIAVLVIIGAISVALPLAAMGLANVLSARFEIKGVQAGEVPILVGEDQAVRRVVLADHPDRLIDVYKDRVQSAVASGPRRFGMFRIEFRARGTFNPFGAPTFIAMAPSGFKILSSMGIRIAGDRQAHVSPGLGFVALVMAADADLASSSAQVPATLVFILRDTSAFAADPRLADRLTNQSVRWERISDSWRPDADERTDPEDRYYGDLSDPGSGAGGSQPDDPYFD